MHSVRATNSWRTISGFRTVLQTVELEKDLSDTATVVSEMDISEVATNGHEVISSLSSGTTRRIGENKALSCS